ncbi:MAG TPA: hypothetical protein VMD91_04430 [Candidatus Sulfotelmatobacter sp.]|nr:hypothetical protein [Candidatus Sulfotelmatobacter sp.]
MITFQRVGTSRLYAGDAVSSRGWWGFVVAANADPPTDPIPFATALTSTKLAGSFAYVLRAPDLRDPFVTTLIAAVDAVAGRTANGRALIWFPALVPSPDGALALGLQTAGDQTIGLFQFGISGGTPPRLLLTVPPAATLTAEDSSLALQRTGVVRFDGPAAPSASAPSDASISFAGDDTGALRFRLGVDRVSLYQKLNWGYQFLTPRTIGTSNDPPYLTVWMPLASGDLPDPNDRILFDVRMNPADPNNTNALTDDGVIRSAFRFVGTNSNGDATVLSSFYRTPFGDPISLTPLTGGGGSPAELVINPGYGFSGLQAGFRFGPSGDFAMNASRRIDDHATLLCGLAGGESIAFVPSDASSGADRLRCTPNQPANVPVFPIPPASPLGPPFDPTQMLLDPTFRTSWASVIAGASANGAPHYAAAPKGADPFGADAIVAPKTTLLLGPKDPGVALSDATLSYPLAPYAGVIPGDDHTNLGPGAIQDLERQVLSVTRRQRIRASKPPHSASARASLKLAAHANANGANDAFRTTTPAGLIATVDGGSFTKLLLGQIARPGSAQPERQICFLGLERELQAAFQTSDLFLVVANATLLGKPADGVGSPPPVQQPATFCNVLNVETWKFRAGIGNNPAYGDYRNVMIVKGVRGKLVDLVTSPDKWTAKDQFAAPTTLLDGVPTEPQLGQLLPLSKWLSEYFDAALAHGDDDPYFANFNRIIREETWTGILFLKVDITDIPPDLIGLLAGVGSPEDFNAHHLGFAIAQVDRASIDLVDSSAVFGLVYYVDPRFDPVTEAPIPASDLGATYDFTLLTLQVLFENTAVVRFHSVAQAVLNRIMGTAVAGMDGPGANLDNAILLRGAYQRNGESAVYSLASTGENTFVLANDVLLQAQIANAQLTTRETGTKSAFTTTTADVEDGENVVVAVESVAGLANGMTVVIGTGLEQEVTTISGVNATAKTFVAARLLAAQPANTTVFANPAVSWLAMSGTLSFVRIPDFDVFSFGSDDAPVIGEGLAFSNLGLRIAFPLQSPATRRLTLETNEIRFDPGSSRARDNSIVRSFQLQLQGLTQGGGDLTPTKAGYLTLATPDHPFSGVDAGNWHGLVYTINLGTPGALAGKLNLTSTLLTAWGDESSADSPQAVLALKLPGTGGGAELFSLQTVISVSVGTPRLYYNKEKASFLLLLSELALKFLSLLKIPPNGSSSFFLFGDRTVKDTSGLGWLAVYNQEPQS